MHNKAHVQPCSESAVRTQVYQPGSAPLLCADKAVKHAGTAEFYLGGGAKVIVLGVDSPQQQHGAYAGHKGQHEGHSAHKLQCCAAPYPRVVNQQVGWDHRVDDPDH